MSQETASCETIWIDHYLRLLSARVNLNRLTGRSKQHTTSPNTSYLTRGINVLRFSVLTQECMNPFTCFPGHRCHKLMQSLYLYYWLCGDTLHPVRHGNGCTYTNTHIGFNTNPSGLPLLPLKVEETSVPSNWTGMKT